MVDGPDDEGPVRGPPAEADKTMQVDAVIDQLYEIHSERAARVSQPPVAAPRVPRAPPPLPRRRREGPTIALGVAVVLVAIAIGITVGWLLTVTPPGHARDERARSRARPAAPTTTRAGEAPASSTIRLEEVVIEPGDAGRP